ncbi:MAG TPA: hypothetical protein VF263_07100 [Longimicrobiaceae bacterium]
MSDDPASPSESGPDLSRLRTLLQDALVELEVWRQNARTLEERSALHRIASALGDAHAEVVEAASARSAADAAQQTLFPGAAQRQAS